MAHIRPWNKMKPHHKKDWYGHEHVAKARRRRKGGKQTKILSANLKASSWGSRGSLEPKAESSKKSKKPKQDGFKQAMFEKSFVQGGSPGLKKR
jgi:hypothetical protein